MLSIQIFDPALCCSTGVCGADVDPVLVNFAADVDWGRKQGLSVERFNLSQQPLVFAQNETVRKFLERSGVDSLPLILIEGEVVMAGRYPTRKELAQWAKIEFSEPDTVKSCCGGNKSGCC